jgi:DNA-binding LacI/PurR family transcriptional regulator
LKTRRAGLVALLVPEIVNTYYTTMVRGAEDVANAHGLLVIVGNTDEGVVKQERYIQLMVSRVDGMIIVPAGRGGEDLQLLLDHHAPTVLIDRFVEGFPADSIRGDQFGGALTLTQHLLALGHRQIAFVTTNRDTTTAREREAGFRLALSAAGHPVDDRLVSAGTWLSEDAETRVAALMDAEVSFSAIVAANTSMAIGALAALRARGRRVPEDVALVCFADIEVAAEIDPFLTVMAYPAYAMGAQAMQLLMERITHSQEGPPREIVLRPRLVVRRSCGASLASGTPASDTTGPIIASSLIPGEHGTLLSTPN